VNNIEKLRKARGLSMEALAYRAGVSVKTIQRLERTGRGHSETLRAVAGVLGVGLDDLFEEVPA